MKRITVTYFLTILFAVSPVFSAQARTANTAAQANNPAIQLAWFYKPPARDLFPVLQENFDFLILTHKDEGQRDELRTMGVTAPISQYLLMAEIRDPGNCTSIPFGNQVAWKAGDFCMINSQHPDWFLLDERGQRIGGGGVYWMDVGNPGFREFWLARARELQEQYGWGTIFIDNVHGGLGKFRSLGVLPQKYKTDDEYRAVVKGFLNYLRTNYFQPAGRKMYANITDTQNYVVWRDYLDYLDGAMVENFAAGWLGRNKTRTEWEEQMNALEVAHGRGKTSILVSQGEQNDAERQEFSFASYLLIANQHAFFRYAKSGAYDQVWLYENYKLNLGTPLSARYREGANWRRDFLNGYVIVNPDTVTAEIVLAPTSAPTPQPTFTGPFVSKEVNPTSLNVGGTASVSVKLNNVPVDGYQSAEFTCIYNASLVEASNIVVANLFGADPAVAIRDPINGTFIVAIAGTNGNKATTSGLALTFNVKGLQAGQSEIKCVARVSKGDNVAIDVPSSVASLTILGVEPSPPPIGLPTSTPIGSPQLTATNIPLESPTPTASLTALPSPDGAITGQVIARKTVTVSLLDANNVAITSVVANPDGTFSLTVPAGNYIVVAQASGFLSAHGSASIAAGSTTTKPTISLLAGDIDGNNVIDPFDALTIGMSYSASTPAEADLNNDATIDFLDLELLAKNYRKTGLIAWE
jgi:hypothetical protein